MALADRGAAAWPVGANRQLRRGWDASGGRLEDGAGRDGSTAAVTGGGTAVSFRDRSAGAGAPWHWAGCCRQNAMKPAGARVRAPVGMTGACAWAAPAAIKAAAATKTQG
jgi:hypothetical protein